MIRAVLNLFVFILLATITVCQAKPVEASKYYYLADDENRYDVESIRKLFSSTPESFTTTDHTINLRFEASNVWILYKPNRVDKSEVLQINNWYIDSIRTYFFREDQLIRSKEDGDRFSFSQRDYPQSFPNFSIPEGTDFICIHVVTTGPLQVPLQVSSLHDYVESIQQNASLRFFYFGFLLLTIILSIFSYYWLKEKIFIYYSVSLFSTGLITAATYGYIFQYIWPENPMLNEYSICLLFPAVFNLLFIEKLLNVKDHSRILFFSFRLLSVIFGVVIFLWPFMQNRLLNELVFGAFFFCALLPVISGIALYRKLDNKTCNYFLAGSAFFFFSTFFYIGASNRLIPLNAFTENSVQIGSAIEILFFNLAILNKIKIFKQSKEEFLLKQNTRLEEKVNLRTIELTEKNMVIAEKNKLLKEQHEFLEKQVAQRTEQLSASNKELNDRNFRLQQFANVTAHNLRGPVATILGLCGIFNKKHPEDPLNGDILKHVQSSAHKVDGILKDLSTLLDHSQKREKLTENVSLDEMLDYMKNILQDEISKNNISIHAEFTEAPTVKAVQVYLKNIFYNLISNSIKYRRRDGIPPEIAISSSASSGLCTIKFRDNGLGLDIKLYKQKMFQPYQRFHSEIEGKGLGLYLIKTQLEDMGGSIEVESELNAGTCFSIILPLPEEELVPFTNESV